MSVCEIPQPGQQPPSGPLASRIHRFQGTASPSQPFRWDGVPSTEYKPAADHHCGVLRSVLVGECGERTAFQLRYFEIAPGGNTTLEHHAHEHVVVVLRGQGLVRLGDQVHPVAYGDTVYVAPQEVHQLSNPTAEPFGFLCLVDAVRDVPVPVPDGASCPPG